MSNKTVMRHLVVNLTEDEITRCSQELARVTTQQAELEAATLADAREKRAGEPA